MWHFLTIAKPRVQLLLTFTNIALFLVTDTLAGGRTVSWGRFQPYVVSFLYRKAEYFSCPVFIQLKPAFLSSSQCKTG